MPELKVCFIANASVHTDKWLAMAREKGMEVVWIRPVSKRKNHAAHAGVPEIKVYDLSSVIHYLGYFHASLSVGKIVAFERPDVVHGHYLTHNGIVSSLVGKKTPVVVSAWGTDVTRNLSRFPFNKLVPYALKNIDLLTTCGEHIRRSLLHQNLVTEKKCINVPFGVDTKLFAPTVLFGDGHEYDVISNRHHEPIYDIQTLLQALYIVRKKYEMRLKTLILGDGSQTDYLMNISRVLGIESQVTFQGNIPSDMMPEHLSKARFYVSCSLDDGMSTSLLEAMSCGLVPVVSDIEANKPWISPDNGLTFRVSNPYDLAAKLYEVACLDSGDSTKLRRASMKIVKLRGSLEATVGCMEQYYSYAQEIHAEKGT